MEKDNPSPKPEEHSTISKSRRLESQVLLQSLYNMVSKGIKTEEERILYLIGEGEEQRSLGPILQIIPSGKETYIDAKFSSYIDKPAKWEKQYIFMEKELVINLAQNGNESLIIVLCKNGCILVESGAYVNFQDIDLVNRPIFIIKPNASFAPITKDNQLIRLKSGLHLIVLTNETILIFVDKSGLRSESNIGCGQYQPLLIEGVLRYKKSGNISDSNEPKDLSAESIKENKDDRKLNRESLGAYSILIEDIIHARNLGIVFSLRIGYGCFSDVFKGKFNDETVAIKVIHHNKYGQSETYMQEKYVCGLLKVKFTTLYECVKNYFMSCYFLISQEKTHKNIIKFSQVFDNFDKSETWILMEWLDGKDMKQILRENGIPFAEHVAKSYFKQLVDGLKFLHSLGIVHRDIKTENIILCVTENTMVPKFIDFGFAKKVHIKEDNKALCGSHKGSYQSFLCDF
jgi:hypothetical protein